MKLRQRLPGSWVAVVVPEDDEYQNWSISRTPL